MSDPRILIIGLDGATWDLIKQWVDEGKLPTFKKLMVNGVWGDLESTIPPWTIPAWESMSTGKNPGKLGFATFMVKDGYRFVPHNFKHKRQRSIWELLSNKGYDVIVANLPNIYAAQKINGCMVAGWLCLDKHRITQPPDLIDELNKCCDGYKMDIFDVDFEKGQIVGGPKDDEYLECCKELLEKHFSAFRYLLKKYKWDFGFIVFVTPDRLQHRCWDAAVLFEHYKEVDKKLKKLLEMIDDRTVVFLVSDHGFGPVKYTLNINEFLIKEGYLKLKGNEQRRTSTLFTIMRKSKMLFFIRPIFRLLPATAIKYLRKKCSLISFEKMNIDWNNTKAFAYSVAGDIYLNLEGREPEGVVAPEEYDKLREEIIEKTRNLRYKGKKLNIAIFKKEEIYPNATLWDSLPDLVILPTDDGIQAINPNVGTGKIISINEKCEGNHRLNGIFLAYGPGIKKGL